MLVEQWKPLRHIALRVEWGRGYSEKPGNLCVCATGHAQMGRIGLPKSCFDYNSKIPCGRLRLQHTLSLLPWPRLDWEE